MPSLNWIGKEAVVNHDKEVSFRLLKKVKSASVGKDSQNLIIHGDNLEALKALMPYYAGKIKCIYIDPPYNTGNESWIYNDKVNSPKIRQWLGKTVGREFEDLTRHDKWLCMMYPRLKLLRDLMSNNGAIFVSIDDNEYCSLKIIMDEIFGKDNFVASVVVKMSHLSGVKMSHTGNIPKLKEYLCIYAKNKDTLELSIPQEKVNVKEQFARYKSFVIKNISDERDVSKWRVITLKEALGINNIDPDDENQLEDFYKRFSNNIFRTARNRSSQFTSLPEDSIFRKVRTPTGLDKIAYKREEVLFVSQRLINGDFSATLGDIWSDIGINNLHNEGFVEFRNAKKPLKLIKRLIKMVCEKDSLILDSFAGSGTTGHAVLDLNKEDGGSRKFIMIEMEDKVAKDVTAERIKKVIKEYNYNDGFDYCELDKPLFNEEGQIENNCDFSQLATYIYFTETQKNIVKKEMDGNFIGSDGDVEFYLIYKEPKTNDLDKAFIKKLKKTESRKVVYADRCLLNEETLAQCNITFKQIPYEVKVF